MEPFSLLAARWKQTKGKTIRSFYFTFVRLIQGSIACSDPADWQSNKDYLSVCIDTLSNYLTAQTFSGSRNIYPIKIFFFFFFKTRLRSIRSLKFLCLSPINSFYTAHSAGQNGCVNMLQLRSDSYRTNQSKAGKSKLFCDWLTKQSPGWH